MRVQSVNVQDDNLYLMVDHLIHSNSIELDSSLHPTKNLTLPTNRPSCSSFRSSSSSSSSSTSPRPCFTRPSSPSRSASRKSSRTRTPHPDDSSRIELDDSLHDHGLNYIYIYGRTTTATTLDASFVIIHDASHINNNPRPSGGDELTPHTPPIRSGSWALGRALRLGTGHIFVA